MANMKASAILDYMDYRKWRSALFLNLSLLAFGSLLAKIAANFSSGKPGFAGIRVMLSEIYIANIVS